MLYFFNFLIISTLIFFVVLATYYLYAQHLTKASGWDVLTIHYRAYEKPTDEQLKSESLSGRMLKSQSLMVGPTFFNKSISIGATEDGLYLSSWFTRRALLIPWYDLGKAKEVNMGNQRGYAMKIGDPPIATITFPMQLYIIVRTFTEHKR